jgi:hypothetical protein
MSKITRILDELFNQIPRRTYGRTIWRFLSQKPQGTIRHIGREVEELESRYVPTLLGQQLFPSDNPWNQNIANAPVVSNSTAIMAHIGDTIKLHPDFGIYGNSLYGIPFNVVHGNSVPKVNVIIDGYPSQSDILPVPIPANAVIEGDYANGPNLNGAGYNSGQRGDSHLIIWDEDNNMAYELFGASRPNDLNNSSGQWEAIQETVWNMNTDQFRELGWTSADAAGLSILAGLIRPDEGLPTSQGGQGAIDHAIRFTLPSGDINPQYIYPASHIITVSSQSSTSLPLGARLRLENNPTVDALISDMGPEAQIIATAMQQYGLILADDGSAMFVSGSSYSVDANNTPDLYWDMNDVLGLESLTANDFQVLNLAPIVTGLSTTTGSAGSTVTITGQDFSGAAGNLSVFFGATASPTVTYVSDTEITAVVPSGTGTVDVTVQSGVSDPGDSSNSNGSVWGYGVSAKTSADKYTYSSQTVSGSKSTVSFASSTDPSGTGDLLTFVIEDTNGNPISGLPGSAFSLSLSGGTSTGTFGSVMATSTPGTYTATFTGSTAGTASTLTATVSGVQLTSEPTVQVTPGSVSGSKSTVSFASSSDASGTADTVTIAVEDAAGNAIPNLPNSDFVFSLTGGTSTGTFGTVTQTGTPGTYTAAFTGTLAGTADTLTLKVNTVALTGQPKVTVTPGSPSGGNSSVSFATSTVASGQTDTATIVVKDAAGNAVTGLSNSAFTFSLSGGTSTGTFGTVTPSSTAGTYTSTFTAVTAGTVSTLTATVNGVQISTKPTVQVTAGGVGGGNSTVSFANSSVSSGNADTVTIVVKDQDGNSITNLSNSDFSFSLSGGTSTGTFGTVTETTTPGTYTTNFTGVTAGTASTLTLKIDSVQLTTQPQVTVTAGAISGSNSTVSFASGTDQSGAPDTVTIAVKDAAGNAITGLSNSAFNFSLAGGTSTGTFGTVTASATAGTYTTTFSGAIAGTASTLTLTVSSVKLTSQPQVTVTAGAVSGSDSTVSFAAGSDQSGAPDTVTMVVKDADGNAVSGLASSAFSFSLAGGTSNGTFGTVTETSTHGTYTATFTGTTDGTASTLTLKINSVQLTTQPQVTVTVGAVSGSNSSVSFATGSDQSGIADTVTIVAKDAAGNAITGLSNSAFTFSLSGGTSTGTFGTVTASSTPGTYTTTFTGATAGTASTLTLKINSTQLTSQPQVTVTTGTISGTNSTVNFAAGADPSGIPDTVTIVVKDIDGNAVTGLASNAFSFSLAGGTSTGTFGTVSATSTPGTYTTAFTGVTAGSASTLTLKINSVQLTTQPQVTVNAGTVSSTNSTVSFATGSDQSGTSDTVTIVVKDAAGNPIAALSNSAFDFSLAGGTSTGSFGTVTPTSTTGTYTTTFTGATAGTADTLTLDISSVQLTAQPQVTVTVGAVSGSNSSVSFASGMDQMGVGDIVTIVAKDVAGNAITGLSNSAFNFDLWGGTSSGTFGTVSAASSPGTYTATFMGTAAGTADTLTQEISGVQLNTQPQVTVTGSSVSGTKSSVSFASSTDKSGTPNTVTINVEDTSGNAISGLTNSDFNFSLAGGTSTGSFGTVTQTSTPGTYTATFTGFTAGTASTLTLDVNSVQLSAEPKVTVKVGAVSGSTSTVSFATPTVASGNTDKVTIVAKDAAGNLIGGLANSAFAFSLSGGTSTGKFSKVAATSSAGTYTATFTGVTAGTPSALTLKISGVALSSTPSVQVTAGGVNSAETAVGVASPTVASGTSDVATIIVRDAAKNVISGLPSSAFAFGFVNGTSTGTFNTVKETSTPGTYTVNLTGVAAGTASSLIVKVDGVVIVAEPKATVKAGTVSGTKSSAAFLNATVAVGQLDTLVIVVKDAAGNPITGLTNSNVNLKLSGGTSTGTFGNLTATSTPGDYTVLFKGVSSGTASTITITIDGVELTSEPTIQVT